MESCLTGLPQVRYQLLGDSGYPYKRFWQIVFFGRGRVHGVKIKVLLPMMWISLTDHTVLRTDDGHVQDWLAHSGHSVPVCFLPFFSLRANLMVICCYCQLAEGAINTTDAN